MGRSAEMPCGLEARLLLLLWFANLSLAIPSGVSPDEVGVLAPEAGLGDTGVPNNLVSPVGDGVELAQLAVGTKGDGCSGAYKKFKANIAKMTTLKTKEGKKKADSLYKRCKKDHKEIISKATWKKAVIKKKIKIGSDKRYKKLKRKLDSKMKSKSKKMKKTIAKAKKKATSATAKMKKWKAKYKKTKRDLKAKYKQQKIKFKTNYKIKMKKKVKNDVKDKVMKKSRAIKKRERQLYNKKLAEAHKKSDHRYEKQKKTSFLKLEDANQTAKRKIRLAKKEVPPPTQKDLAQTKENLKTSK